MKKEQIEVVRDSDNPFRDAGLPNPDVLNGTPVFTGTRVPVDALISNLEAGLTVDAFLENFPSVSREQALEVLEFSKATLLKLGHAS